MASDVYQQLREQLDQYSVGFPATESGVEIKLLQKLFSEEAAEMFLQLTLMLETPDSVAQRIGQKSEQVAELLDDMADKGLIFRHRKNDQVRYAAAPFIVGFFEYSLPNVDREFAQLMEDYFEQALAEQGSRQPAMMRTIPVKRALEVSYQVAPHDDAAAIIRSKDNIVVADCICRKGQDLLDNACDSPREVCFMFGSHADYFAERGIGRRIDQDEALKILEQCEQAGLVTQPFNAVNPGGMCNCCGDCCGVLRMLKKHPRPAEVMVSSYFAAVDPEECVGCEICLDRCQMKAIAINDDNVAEVNLDRCIGCGLCVTTCETEAISLVAKPEEERPDLPKSGADSYMRMAQSRGTSLVPLRLRK